jgi:hypothetical protein
MATVFVLQHEHDWCGRDEVKFIGVYAVHADAQAAIERLRDQPGFRDWPEGFTIDGYEVGVDHWSEGFATMVSILVPSRANPESFQVAGSIWRPGDLYKISDVDRPDEARFGVGDIVRCQLMPLVGYGEAQLVATEVVSNGNCQRVDQ